MEVKQQDLECIQKIIKLFQDIELPRMKGDELFSINRSFSQLLNLQERIKLELNKPKEAIASKDLVPHQKTPKVKHLEG